ncbi:MAG: TlpA family protein disulfide reductase [Deltaproteobacteria bacterium]|nr:TlpA family protein disulfide reductase [Deltaproteobacteria bacterium]
MARRAFFHLTGRVWLIAVVAAGIAAFISQRAPTDGLGLGAIAPAFSLPVAADTRVDLPAGTLVSLNLFPKHVRLINFWSTTCGPCLMEIPSLNRLAAHFAGRDFQILAISEDGDQPDPWGTIAQFQQRVPMQFPILLDSDGRVADLYGTYVIPESFLVDRSGRVVRRITGAIRWDDPEIVAEIERLVLEPS